MTHEQEVQHWTKPRSITHCRCRRRCRKQHRTAHTFIRCALDCRRGSVWGAKDACYALVCPCGYGTTVSLWRTLAEAESAKSCVDRFGCGAQCDHRTHYIAAINQPERRTHVPTHETH